MKMKIKTPMSLQNSPLLYSCFALAISMFSPQMLLAEMPSKLPPDLKWLTNEIDSPLGSPEAKPGGIFHEFMLTFPPTLRNVGPDSNHSFQGISQNQFPLVSIHPNTENLIPCLANQWAFGSDKRSMYFKLNRAAKWSDGKPVTAEDYLFTIEFMRSKFIVAPWYNDFYTKEIEGVVKYDDDTIGVFSPAPKPNLQDFLSLTPIPKHYYGKLDTDFVKKYNWAIVPNNGPYQLTEINKGKSFTFTRVKDWWGNDQKFFKNRYNVDKVEYKVIREMNVALEHFKKGEIDHFTVTNPDFWHIKATGPLYDRGLIRKLWFYTDSPRSPFGLYLNEDVEPFKNINVRLAFQHAMNFEKVIKTVLRNDYERLDGDTIGYGKYTNHAIKAREFSLEKADEYLKKAGWITRGGDGIRVKDGKRLSSTITYSSDTQTQRLVILKEEAKKAGIELNLQLMDGSAQYKSVMEKKHEIAWWAWTTNLRPAYWEHYHSENAHKPQTNNISNMDNKELDKLIDQYRASVEEPDRIKLAQQIQQIIHDNAGFIPAFMIPYFRIAYWSYWRMPTPPAARLSGDGLEPFGDSDGGLFWLDQEARKTVLAALNTDKKFPAEIIIDKTYKAK